ncbi:protease s28 pro-x carboxypeptidase-related [Anaeramoeba flamelloides]|uniref:Protease s28 pro-x carboxypeptidase-related n=1 Tax=Anaeramoeba flamelloides TaxID=1746091 RepID=A0AAV7ZU62_9EUKA|nr:protease s28 pro-x carboxypeptidase-related [Anaeramoeba flamelloides]
MSNFYSSLFFFFFLISSWYGVSSVEFLTYDQKLDHFDHTSDETFKQRYYVNDTNYIQGGPVLFVLNGESKMEDFYFEYGFPFELSAQHGAFVAGIEHRFYGESNPFGNDISDTENFKQFTTQQTLADYANFRDFLIKEYSLPQDTKFFVFGCSYSGILSAWLPVKYPNLFDGAFSGSSPVLAEKDWFSFNKHVEEQLPQDCFDSIQEAVSQLKPLWETVEGRIKLTEYFNPCEDIMDDFHAKMLNYRIITPLQIHVQYQNPPNWPMTVMCENMTRAQDKLAMYIKVFGPREGSCMVNDAKKVFNNAWKLWYYQKATELGYYKLTTPNSPLFFDGIDSEFHNQIVSTIFGKNFIPNTNYTNLYYGGMKGNFRNTIFTNGKYDPWSLLSITDQTMLSNNSEAFVYDDAGHCAPYHFYNPAMPPGVLEARKKISEMITKVTGH